MTAKQPAPHYADDWLTVYAGDALTILRELDAGSVHCCVTSPPYWGLRDYGQNGQLGLEPTPEQYVANLVAVFREVRRVLRDDGTLWLNLGDSYNSAPPGGNPGGFQGASMRAHPAYDAAYPRDHAKGAGWKVRGLKPKDLVGIPWRVAFALQADGWYLRSDIIWAKPNPMPESVTDRPTKSHEYIFLLSKSARYYYDQEAVAERAENAITVAPTRNLRSVWTIATRPYPGAHFAVFPPELPERCIKAGSAELGVVLDPFAGSGTVGLVANRLSRRAVLIDLNPAYIEQQMLRNAQVPVGL